MRVLIAGGGIAGPTLAWWLDRYGFDVTIVEKSPVPRTEGYVIDFWGSGFEIAERMGLLPDLQRNGYRVQQVKVVNRRGNKIAGFPAAAFDRATAGKYLSLPRGELAASLLAHLQSGVEIIFGDSISTLNENDAGVRVSFRNGDVREFDLVVGADGLHSRTRELAFGKETLCEKFLGYKAAAFTTQGYRPRDESAYVMYTEVGQQLARFSMRDDRTMFLFTFADSEMEIGDLAAHKSTLRKHFGASGWESNAILDALDRTNQLYFDRVSQIRMDAWSRGRVALVGDAAYCVSLLAGQGSALAMTGAYILAGELHRANGDHRTAFARYQELLRPLIQSKQAAALRFAGTFAPKSALAMWFRNRLFNLLQIGWIADLAIGRDLADRIALPEY